MTTRFPSPPPNYNGGGHDMSSNDHMNASSSTVNFDAVQPAPAVPHRRALTPYLTLDHYLSLTWLAYPIISLLFVAFRLIDSTATATDGVADAKANLLTSCLAAQRAASAAASMPRYLAIGSNDAIQSAVDASMDAARLTMILSLTIVESIIEFVIDIYKSTFLCFVQLVVRGGLALLIGAVQEVSDFVNKTLAAIRTNIQNDVAAANSVIQAAVSAISKVTSVVGVNLSVPQFSIPSLNALANVTLPTDFEDALVKLNASLPTLDDLRDSLDALIEKPFDEVKSDINATFSAISFNASTFTLPAERTLTFCDNMDTSFVDDLGHDLVKLARIGAGLIVAAALLLLLGNMALHWWKWRALQSHLEYIREAWSADPTVAHSPSSPKSAEQRAVPNMTMSTHNLMLFLNSSEHPLISRLLDQASARFRLTHSQHINMRFFFSYTLYPPALVCLLIGLLGLLSVQIQLAAIGPLERHYTAQAAAGVQSFNVAIASQLNAGMANDSSAYAAQVNAQIGAVQTTLNNGVFGWVNQTTTSLNNTVVGFYNEVQSIVNSTFGGTLLDGPAQEFVKCMIGGKVQNIEDALTFLNEHFKVDMPTMSPNVLMLSNDTVNEVTAPIALAAIGSPSNTTASNSTSTSTDPPSQGLVAKLIARYVAALHRERLMFAIFLAIWAFVALCALGIIAWHAWGQERLYEWKRRRYGFDAPVSRSSSTSFATRGVVATPWVASGAGNGQVESFPKGDGEYTAADAHLAAPQPHPYPTIRISDNILAADAAVASAYLAATTGSKVPSSLGHDDERIRDQYSSEEDRRYRGPAVDGMDFDGERTPLPENLRQFTPLQTPNPASSFNLAGTTAANSSSATVNAKSATRTRKESYDSFLDAPRDGDDLEKGSDAKTHKKGGLSWGAVAGKLRNDARRVTAREPYDFNFGMPIERTPTGAGGLAGRSQFDHSPAPETAQNGWFSRAVNAVWGFGGKNSDSRASTIEPYHLGGGEKARGGRQVINLDSDEGRLAIPPVPTSTLSPEEKAMRQMHHQSIFAPPPQHPSSSFTLGAPPPAARRGARMGSAHTAAPAAVSSVPASSRAADFPQSVQTIDGELGFASAPRSAAPTDMSISPPNLSSLNTTPSMSLSPPNERQRYLSTTYYAEQSNSALPIHHQFVAPELRSLPSTETIERLPPPSPDERDLTDPFADNNEKARKRPSRSAFPPPGLLASRTLTPPRRSSSAGNAPRMRSSVGADHDERNPFANKFSDANPFAGSPSPFEDPVFPFNAAPPAASNNLNAGLNARSSFASGVSGNPRAI